MKVLIAALLAAALSGCAAAPVSAGALVDVSVINRTTGQPVPTHYHQGNLYIAGTPGERYAIRIANRTGRRVMAVVSVDGVNVVSGETAHVQQGGYLLSPGRALEVKGWRKDLARTAAFYFTPLADSYAARTGRPDNVGAIGVALFRRKAPDPAPLSQIAPSMKAERSDAPARAAAADGLLGTGHGRRETSYARLVDFERATHEPAETVVLYYDSYANLVARGIIPAEPSGRRPAPNPFPGFVPDPPA
jgi:hypothetical protein